MRKRGTPEKLVRIVKATYEKVTTRVRLPFGDTEEFKIKVGLHQRSALSSFLSILVLDTLTGHIGTEISWELIFADDIAWIARTEEELERKILNWQDELKISRFEDEC